tara:strand:+ start:1032 stop:1940 length:909 start_codon:yes stop_codon:yes gene_type:complete
MVNSNLNQKWKLKIGNAPCSWGIYYPNNNFLKYDKYIMKLSDIGYQYSELGPLGYFNDEISIIKDLLTKYNIHISGSTHVHSFADLSMFEKLKTDINKISDILLNLNSSNLIVMDNSQFYSKNNKRNVNFDDWKEIMKNIIEIQNFVENEYGIKLHFHPHVGTFIEYEEQIDKLLNDTNISLCFDTGHHAFWNQSSLNYLKKVISRVGYIHLKNVNDTIRQKVWNNEISIEQSYDFGVMSPLEYGFVNISDIIKFLLKKEFSGFCVIEQDPENNNEFDHDNLAKNNLIFVEKIIKKYFNTNL